MFEAFQARAQFLHHAQASRDAAVAGQARELVRPVAHGDPSRIHLGRRWNVGVLFGNEHGGASMPALHRPLVRSGSLGPSGGRLVEGRLHEGCGR